jgi:hypothetical protein
VLPSPQHNLTINQTQLTDSKKDSAEKLNTTSLLQVDNNKQEENESVEIKVEEGYATRQMDEYFRQTIAAIKEELTRKLDKNIDATTLAEATNDVDDIGDFSDHSDTDNEIEIDNDHLNEDANYYDDLYKANRNAIYQQLGKKEKNSLNGFLVFFGTILNQSIIEGLFFNYTILFDLIHKHFSQNSVHNSNLSSTLPITFLIGFYLMSAPLANFCAKFYGPRRTSFIGTLLATLSLLISSLQTNLFWFSFFYGILTGLF